MIQAHTEVDEATSSSLDKTVCGICQRQISRYTCPSCNLSYCSLKCFRSEPHARCSEKFYRKEIEVGIKSAPEKTEEDRNKMLELLKRFEDQNAADEVGLFHLGANGEDEEDSLAQRFSQLDIPSASTDDLIRLLTKKERDTFFTALKYPSGGLVRDLLQSAEYEETRRLPWWLTPSDGSQSSHSQRASYGVKPHIMTVPTGLISRDPPGVSLLYNVCATLLAYAYVTRHLAMSPLSSTTNDAHDQHEARRVISRSVPFLIDPKSKTLHMALTDVVLSFWSRIDPGSIDNESMLVLLEDVAIFMRPRSIIVTGDKSGGQERAMADHPSATAVMAISDMTLLFSHHTDSSHPTHVEMKLTFYAAHILSTPRFRLHAFADEILLLSKKMDKEESCPTQNDRLVVTDPSF